jgi:hypothetical protein
LINTKKTSKSKANPTMKEKKDSSIGVVRVFKKGGKSANQAAFTGADSMRIRGHPSRSKMPTLVEYKSFSPNAKTLREARSESQETRRGGQARLYSL